MQPHSDHYEIIKLILQTIYLRKNGISRSFEIAYRCQLSLQQFIYYRDILLRRNLLSISSGVGSNQHYEITPKGEHYLQLFTEIEEDLRPVISH
jgi:predicted transcriptional regulator